MIEAAHQIETPDGTLDCFSVHAEDAGAYAAVILYMDAPGIGGAVLRKSGTTFEAEFCSGGKICATFGTL